MLRSHALDKLAGGLAAAFLAGEWSEAGLVRRGLLGRIAWVEQLNPARGRKLHERFGRIDWGG